MGTGSKTDIDNNEHWYWQLTCSRTQMNDQHSNSVFKCSVMMALRSNRK